MKRLKINLLTRILIAIILGIGTGTNVDQLLSGTAEVTYNLPHWRIGVEYNHTAAWYGDLNPKNGKIVNTHSVGNNRFVASASFMF